MLEVFKMIERVVGQPVTSQEFAGAVGRDIELEPADRQDIVEAGALPARLGWQGFLP